MRIKICDYNGAEGEIDVYRTNQWEELRGVLEQMPLHLKASDQAGIRGNPIFDPVGTNHHIKEALSSLGWRANIPIPNQFSFLGTDVDFGKAGVLCEVQFSNYPFLLNNLLRSELFYKTELPLSGEPTGIVVIITKAHMFPASNSTLYYEQAKNQLDELARYNVFDIPIRLVGLFEPKGEPITVMFTTYSDPRYSRTVEARHERQCILQSGKTSAGRSRIDFVGG